MAGRAPPHELELHEATDWMNTNPDALTAIVKHRTDTKGHLGFLYITRLMDDRSKLEIAIHPPPDEKEQIIYLDLQPPLRDNFELRPRLKLFRDLAYEHFKVPTTPTVDYFSAPNLFPYTLPAVLMLTVLFFASYGTGDYADWLRDRIEYYLGPLMLPFAQGFAALLHLLVEPAYMIYLTGKHKTPFLDRLKWIICNITIGFGAINEYHECVMYERQRKIYMQTDVGDLGPRVKSSAPVTEEKKSQ